MSTSKKKVEKLINPFAEFSLLKGEFPEPDNIDNEDSDIITGEENIIKEEIPDLDISDNLEKGDKAIADTIEKAKKLKQGASIDTILNNEDNEVEDNIVVENGYKTVISGLYEKGILDVDLENIEDTEEAFDTAVNETVEKRINKWVEALPEDYTKFLDFVQSGGNPKEFLDIYYGNHSWEDFKIDNEDSQKLVVKESLRLSGETPEDIDEIVTEWFDNGTLEKRAKSALVKVQKNETYQKEQIIKNQELISKRKEQEATKYWDDFKKDLFSKEEIKGFKLTPKVKEKLWDHMTIIDRKTGKTAYQIALEKDNEASLLFALQSMNGFDISKLEKQVQTKVSNNINSLLKNYSKDSKSKISSGSSPDVESTDPFAMFKNVKA